ncbi:MAG: F0F1 ATP synthase assembly protein I [Candidatus Competibacteraceae bacterium]|nr:F0F1 ATP synthase assembly protein I [Candidatus Competibacteraceae bacterium]
MQLVITCIAVVFCLFLADLKAVYSAGLGGGISVIVTVYFAVQVFSGGGDFSAVRIATRFYVGEVIKIALTAVLFGITIIWLDVSFLPLFLTYAATLLAYWLVLPFTLDTLVKTS